MRSRNIKPGFFKNEILGQLPPIVRLLFIGLWTYADKEGRFEVRPLRIKAELFPYDNIDIVESLNILSEKNFIRFFQNDGKSYAQVIHWQKHQRPHYKEAESEIPSPEKSNIINELVNVDSTSVQRRVNVESIKTLLDPLIPDSLIPDCGSATLDQPKSTRAKGKQIPDNFSVTAEHETLAEKNGWPSPHDEIDHFRDYHVARGTVFKNWDRAFYTWLRNAKKFNNSKNLTSGDKSDKRNRRKSTAESFWEDFERGSMQG